MAAARLQRWAIQLSGYQYEIRYRSSSENANADGLSRLPLPTTVADQDMQSVELIAWSDEAQMVNTLKLSSLPITPAKISRATERDCVLSRVKHYIKWMAY